MRINRFLSLAGVASRRKADELVLSGAVLVNGHPAELNTQVAETDTVLVNGAPLHAPRKFRYLAYHKPAGVVCTASDPQGRRTLYDDLPPAFHSFKYIGRLDLQSRGLVLLTDDGDLVQNMSHPRFQVPRSYFVWTDYTLSRHDAEALLGGIDIGEGETGRALSVLPGDGYFELVLTEGKNREIRRMMQALGLRILDLKRVSFGPVQLEGLAAGAYRELAPETFSAFLEKRK